MWQEELDLPVAHLILAMDQSENAENDNLHEATGSCYRQLESLWE